MIVSDFTELVAARGHEQVVFVGDQPSGLRAIIAVHSTALGPSLGGIRFWHYDTEEAALVDVLRLSEAMSLKASAAGLPVGGGKAVVLLPEIGAPHPDDLLRAMGRAIDDLGGRYLAAEDVGASQGDMDTIALETRWVTGVDPARGGSGDPSAITAYGVLCGMQAACAEVFGDRSVEGRHVVVQGAGHVGAHLARLLVASGARVHVADIDPSRVGELAREIGVAPLATDRVLEEPCDILAPCALGGTLTHEAVAKLRCPIVAGAANNQLADPTVDDALRDRDVLYAPDFVVNAGGIINLAAEFTGYERDRAIKDTARIEDRTAHVFAVANERDIPPGRAAEAIARERIANEALPGGRWRPGDPAAWTGGLPLTALRPGA